MSVVTYAPTFKVLRTVTSNDVVAAAIKRQGANLADFNEVMVMLSPVAGATAATLQLYFWSDAAGKFVPESTPVTLTATANGIIGRLETHRHSHVFFAVTGIAGSGEVKVEVAGVPAYHEAG